MNFEKQKKGDGQNSACPSQKIGLWDKDMSLPSSCHWISCDLIIMQFTENVNRRFCRTATTFVERKSESAEKNGSLL